MASWGRVFAFGVVVFVILSMFLLLSTVSSLHGRREVFSDAMSILILAAVLVVNALIASAIARICIKGYWAPFLASLFIAPVLLFIIIFVSGYLSSENRELFVAEFIMWKVFIIPFIIASGSITAIPVFLVMDSLLGRRGKSGGE